MQALRQRLEIRFQTARSSTGAYLRKMQRRYKLDSNRCVREAPTLCSGDLGFINRSALLGIKSGIADNIITKMFEKLLLESLGPLHDISTSS